MTLTIYEVIREQRRKLIARDRDALLNVTRGFAIARREISRSLLELLNEMSAATTRGEKITESWLRKANRLHTLKSQAAGAISRFSVGLELSVLNGQRAEVEQAVRDAAATYHAARSVNPRLPIEFDRLHDDAAQTMIGQLGDGSPLSRLIGQFPKQAAALAEEGLIQGIAIGRNPRDTALRLQSAMSSGGMLPTGGPDEVFESLRKIRTRSLAIARTETLRSYRSSSLATYEANSGVVTGWIWIATLDTRTCASCWAMHGTKHSATEAFGSHVNCRCSPAPDIEGVDLGIRTGEERFALLDSEKQLDVLGAKKFELYREKKIALADAVAYSEDKDWGPQRLVASADRALRNAHRRVHAVQIDLAPKGVQRKNRGKILPTHRLTALHPSLEPFAENFEVRDAERESTQRHLASLSKVPPELFSALFGKGLKRISIANRVVGDFEEFAEIRQQYLSIEGAYWHELRTVFLGGKASSASLNVSLHEVGHAAGHILELHDSAEWLAIYRAILPALSEPYTIGGPEFGTGAKEAFAEALAAFLDGRLASLSWATPEIHAYFDQILRDLAV